MGKKDKQIKHKKDNKKHKVKSKGINKYGN